MEEGSKTSMPAPKEEPKSREERRERSTYFESGEIMTVLTRHWLVPEEEKGGKLEEKGREPVIKARKIALLIALVEGGEKLLGKAPDRKAKEKG